MSLDSILRTFAEDREVVLESEPELKFVEKTKEGISLKGVLQRGRLKLVRSKKARKAGITFRPSMITFGFCRRLKIGQLAGVVDIWDTPAKPRQQIIFDMGNAFHEIIQRYFWDIGILKGSYYCSRCDKTYDDLMSPTECPSGKKNHTKRFLEYREVKLWDEEHRISGRADGILMIEEKPHLMDIKSIANRCEKTSPMQTCYEDVKRDGPREKDVIQLILYMYITGIRDAHLLYVAKNDGQIVSYSVPYDFSVIEPYLTEIKELLSAADRLKAGELDELPSCCDSEICPCHTVLLGSSK